MHIPAPIPATPAAEDCIWLRAHFGRADWPSGLTVPEMQRCASLLASLSLGQLLDAAEGLRAEGRPAGAAALYKAWLGRRPAAPEACVAWFNLGVVLAAEGDAAQAATAYGNALLLRPDLHQASINLGLALEAQGKPAEAMAAWRRALPQPELRQTLHNHVGRMLEGQGRLEDAAAEYRASLLVDPDQPDVQQHWAHLRQRMCRWPVLQCDLPGLPEASLAMNVGPLAALAMFDDPARQRDVAAAWIARKVPPAPERLAPSAGYAHDRIRIGYLSSDFCRHAMSYLIAEVLERHDRGGFEVFGYCTSPEDGSDLRARILAALDHHVPIGALSDEAAARRIRADEIDILVDLNGLTRGARLGVLRWKPAPVQATYLGYIGPVPLPELDWLICDEVTVPPGAEADYAPAPLRLPGCFQANDSRPPELPPVSRTAEGLPEEAFVFCCFSHHYKVTPQIFEAWLAILERTPHGVLWLVDDGPASRQALTGRWTARGLAADRLIFAGRVDPARYRARMALGDLFLDTSPYNAGTIASDALRMGLPLLTLAGRAFAARMATSLLTAMRLPECIATDLEDYVGRAMALAHDPGRHAALRAAIGGEAWARSLGDGAGFTRRLEEAYRRVRLRP